MMASLHVSLSIWEGNTLQNVILGAGSPEKSLWNVISFKTHTHTTHQKPTGMKYHMLGATWESESFSSFVM